MFELEDYDLDDEVFLNTQMPTTIDGPKIKSRSNSRCVASNFEENDEEFLNISDSVFECQPSQTENKSSGKQIENIDGTQIQLSNSNCVPLNFDDDDNGDFDDESLINLSNSVFELEHSRSQNVEPKDKWTEENVKIESNIHNDITHNVSFTEHNSETTNPISECQLNKNKLSFDDCFDSDDEAFFNTPDILHESSNSSKANNYTTELNSTNDYQSVSSFISSESPNSTLKFSNIKSFNKSNCDRYFNTTVTNVKTMTPKCASRKFPGPAGLLSENEDLHSKDPSDLESLDMSINVANNDKKEENLCTQVNDSTLSSSPYQQFLSDFAATDVDTILDKYNVAWIKQKLLPYIASGRFFTDKIPFFVSVIKEIDCLSPDPTVILADKTGCIRGTIHRAVWNQFSSQLKLGTVLVLSKVGVSCQKIVKGFTLNITSDHLIAIYSVSSNNVQEVIVTRTTNLTNEEIINDAKSFNLFNMETLINNPHSEIKSRMTALHNLKLNNVSLAQNSELSNSTTHIVKNTAAQSTPVKSLFKLNVPVSHTFFKNSFNVPEEPPAKRTRHEECKLKNEENYSNNEMSIIQNIFEGIDEDEMFNDFCC